MSQFWSNLVHHLEPYTPGEQPQIAGLIKLNTNENPYGPSPRVLEAIRSATSDELRKYPDPNAQALKQTLADHHGLESNQVFLGNSSDEVLAHAFRAFFKQDAPLLFPDLTYSFYPVYCGLFEIDYQLIPLDSQFEIQIDDYQQPAGGVIFANPNAPTGIFLALEKISALARRFADRVILIDEAYVDFGGQSAISLIKDHPNILVCQTYSKSRCLAGLRVGMAFGNPILIEGLERVKNSFHPYALSRLAIAGATASISDHDYFLECLEKVKQTREVTVKRLQQLGFEVLPSQANFVLAQHAVVPAEELMTYLRSKKIIVRHFKHPRIRNFLRISIGTDAEMDSLIEALRARCN